MRRVVRTTGAPRKQIWLIRINISICINEWQTRWAGGLDVAMENVPHVYDEDDKTDVDRRINREPCRPKRELFVETV